MQPDYLPTYPVYLLIDLNSDKAFMWNLLGALWTHANKPEMIDLPFKERSEDRGESID